MPSTGGQHNNSTRRNHRQENPRADRLWQQRMVFDECQFQEVPDQVYLTAARSGTWAQVPYVVSPRSDGLPSIPNRALGCHTPRGRNAREQELLDRFGPLPDVIRVPQDAVTIISCGRVTIEGAEERAARLARRRSAQGELSDGQTLTVAMRPIWEVERFEVRWCADGSSCDPADEWSDAVDRRLVKGYLIRLMLLFLPRRNHRLRQAWMARMDVLLDAFSADGDAAFMEQAVEVVRAAVPEYHEHCRTISPNTGKRHNALTDAATLSGPSWFTPSFQSSSDNAICAVVPA